MKVNIKEEQGEKAINNLINFTKEKEIKENPIIKELEEQGVFN